MLRINSLTLFHHILSSYEKKCNISSLKSSLIKLDVTMKKLIDSQQYEKALDLFSEQSKLHTDIAINMALKACTKLSDYKRGMKIQKQLSSHSLKNPFIQTSLIHFYMQCHDIDKANHLFSTINNKSNYIYGAMFKGFLSNKMPEKVLDLLDKMLIKPDQVTLTLVFNACTQICDDRAKQIGIKLLDQISNNFQNNNNLFNSAINMSMKFGDVKRAEYVYDLIKNKDFISNGLMINGYVENHIPEKALDIFEQMDLNLKNTTYTNIFSACTQLADNRAKKIGRNLLKQMPNNIRNDNILMTSAIKMLMKFGDVKHAEQIFKTANKNIITYCVMIKGYIENNMNEKALDLFEELPFTPDNVTYTIIFNTCAQLADNRAKKVGRKLLKQIPNNFRNSTVILTSALDMLMKFGDITDAEQMFESAKKKDIASYGVMINGYVENSMSEKALDIYEQMNLDPTDATYTIVFNACAQLADNRAKKIGRKLLENMPNDFRKNNIILNSAIHMLMRFGDVKHAEQMFELTKKNIITYGIMIKGYVENKMNEKALDLFEAIPFNLNDIIYTIVINACAQLVNDRARRIGKNLVEQMPNNFQNNNILLNSALDMLMKFGDISDAEHMFEFIKKKDIVSYISMMNGYNINHEPLKCLKLFEEMKQEDIIPNENIFTLLIGACSQIGMFSRCQYIVDQIPVDFYNEQRLCNSLINMWGKVGLINNAEKIFQSVLTPDVITYTAMINAYGINGMGLEAIELYRRMPGNLHNEVSHICVLNACSHSGLLDQARLIFNEITIKTKKIIVVMIDCLSRLFLFDEAQEMIDNYETLNSPCLPMYMVMLSGARNARDSMLSQKIYNRMKCLFPDRKENLIAGSILLSNTYLSVGEYDQAKDIRTNRIKELGGRVKVGLSWTEVTGEVVYFRAHDRSHPQSSEIYAEIDRMSTELIEHGHNYDSSWITRPLQEDETIESVLCGHSEKLAIAFNFIQKPVPSIIQIAGNIRICGDCHRATKLIAKIRQCEIIIRDANRIHHFHPNGTCSCQDHF